LGKEITLLVNSMVDMSFIFSAIIVFGATTKCSGRRLISALLRSRVDGTNSL